jgi:xanthine dehydrogenase accessory factor
MDIAWMKRLRDARRVLYVGVLGPRSRRDEVLQGGGVEPNSRFGESVFGPMGLDIGGDLPESVALSVLSQIHAVCSGKCPYLGSV